MTPSVFDGADLPARVLRARLKQVDAELTQGRVAPDVEKVYSYPIEHHDDFSWAVEQLDPQARTLADLAVSGKALTTRLKSLDEKSDGRFYGGFMAIGGGAFAGVVALGMTVAGGPAVKLIGDILGLVATSAMVGGAVVTAREGAAGHRREQVVGRFDDTLHAWGRVLARDEEERRAAAEKPCPYKMLGLEEKKAMAAELRAEIER